MAEPKYQSMVFAVDHYKWGKSIEEARTEMWSDIARFLQMLTKNDNIAVVYDDDTDIIVIQYEHNEHHDAWGCANPYWVDPEIYEAYCFYKDEINSDTSESTDFEE